MHLLKTQRRQWSWTKKRNDQVAHALKIVNELKEYWPLTRKKSMAR